MHNITLAACHPRRNNSFPAICCVICLKYSQKLKRLVLYVGFQYYVDFILKLME